MPEPLLTAAEVAAWLKLNVETVYDLIARHQLPAVRIGGQWRFQEDQVREWLEQSNATHN
jgi:PTS system nitrogen regulatory IIA component